MATTLRAAAGQGNSIHRDGTPITCALLPGHASVDRMKKTNKRITLNSEFIRNLTGTDMGRAVGGVATGRTTGSGGDCIIACTQSCDQCSLWPACPTETSTSTF